MQWKWLSCRRTDWISRESLGWESVASLGRGALESRSSFSWRDDGPWSGLDRDDVVVALMACLFSSCGFCDLAWSLGTFVLQMPMVRSSNDAGMAVCLMDAGTAQFLARRWSLDRWSTALFCFLCPLCCLWSGVSRMSLLSQKGGASLGHSSAVHLSGRSTGAASSPP